MSIEVAIRSTLIANNTIAALTTRCYPVMIPQDPTFPLILYTRITNQPDNLLNGVSGLAYSRFQIEAWGLTYASAKALANAIRGCLNAQKYTVGTVEIVSIVMQSEQDLYEEAVNCHRVIQDYTMWHTE